MLDLPTFTLGIRVEATNTQRGLMNIPNSPTLLEAILLACLEPNPINFRASDETDLDRLSANRASIPPTTRKNLRSYTLSTDPKSVRPAQSS
jgi:hypothetical protein